MKKIIGLLLLTFLISCENEVKDYVTFKGKLSNAEGVEKITIQGRGYTKDITVNADGTFSDTLKVTDGVHGIVSGIDRTVVFLKNGYDLNLEFKGDKFSDGIKFSGPGSESNNFMEVKREFYNSDYANPKVYFKLNKEDYTKKLDEAKALVQKYRDDVPKLDSVLVEMDVRNDKMFFGYIEENYDQMHDNLTRLAAGKTSPEFFNYENFKGGTTSLKDLRGKYVYIDVWATWCAPCKAQIPYLKKLEEQYQGKNITFVSISVDKQEEYETWKKMVKDEELGGIQLYADKNFESEFIVEYGINAIPRFILIDPNGNIVDPDVARPADPKLKELFTELGI